MKKRYLSVALVAMLVLSLTQGLSAFAAEQPRPLRVAVQSFYCSTPVGYIVDNGLDVEAGIPFEILTFNGGAPINEAMAAGLWDVAVTGGAFIFAMAQYNAKLIGHQIDGTGADGNAIYARNVNPATTVKGFNPNFPDVYGSPDTVKGQVLLQNTGTTSQYLAVSYLDALGVAESDMQIVSLDFPQLYSSFATGQGDLSAMTSPHAYKAKAHDDWTMMATLENLGAPLYESIVCTEEAYNTRYDDIVKFISLIYEANDAIAQSEETAFAAAKKWYQDNGKDLSDEDILAEVQGKPFITSEKAKSLDLTVFAMKYADFFIRCDKIEADKRDVIASGICQDVLDKALGK
jgi:NitT/TauT family transport system substrate-binding protein